MRQSVRVTVIAGVLLFAVCRELIAQAAPSIATSRLGLSKAPGVLAAASVQVEMGYANAGLGARTRHTLGEALLRVGLGRQLELRAGLPSYLRTSTATDTVSGMGDGVIAVRRRFTSATGWRPALALQVGSTIPIGAGGVGAGAAQPELGGYAQWRLPEAFQLLAMGVHRHAVAAGDRYGQTVVSAGVRRELLPGLGAQADYGITHSTRAGAHDAHQLRAAAALRIGRNLQLDGYAARSTMAGQRERLFGLGLSARR